MFVIGRGSRGREERRERNREEDDAPTGGGGGGGGGRKLRRQRKAKALRCAGGNVRAATACGPAWTCSESTTTKVLYY